MNIFLKAKYYSEPVYEMIFIM